MPRNGFERLWLLNPCLEKVSVSVLLLFGLEVEAVDQCDVKSIPPQERGYME